MARIQLSTVLLWLPMVSTFVTPITLQSDGPIVDVRDLKESIQQVARKEQFKKTILKALNVSLGTVGTGPKPRHVNKVTPTPTRATWTQHRRPNYSWIMILAEPGDPSKRNAMNFKLDSTIQSRIADVQTVKLVFRVKAKIPKKRQLSKSAASNVASQQQIDSEWMEQCLKGRKKNRKESANTDPLKGNHTTQPTSINTDPLKGDHTTQPTSITTDPRKDRISKARKRRCLRKAAKLKAKQKRLRNKLRQQKRWKVKLIVKMTHPLTNKKIRMPVEKLSNRKEAISVPVPLDFLSAAVQAPSHALKMQIICKNCKRKVVLEKMYKGRGKKNSKRFLKNNAKRRLNPNRPYLYIKYLDLSSTDPKRKVRSADYQEQSSGGQTATTYRRKRSAGNIRCSSNKSSTNNNSISCCSTRVYVTFEQLGLADVIIFPKGFDMEVCLGSCNDKDKERADVHVLEPLRSTTQDTKHSACGPIERGAIDITYVKNDGHIGSKRLQNIVDVACGCTT